MRFAHTNVTLGTFVFCREGSHLVTLRSTTMDPNRTGLVTMNLRSFKQALSHGHAQRCWTISASVASRLAKELFRLSQDMDTIVAMLMEGRLSYG